MQRSARLDPAWRAHRPRPAPQRATCPSPTCARCRRPTPSLPIACVEGWSTSAQWRGVRVPRTSPPSSARPAATCRAQLRRRGAYGSTLLQARVRDDPLTLVALELNGEVLHLDHGYPARLIAPARPGRAADEVAALRWRSDEPPRCRVARIVLIARRRGARLGVGGRAARRRRCRPGSGLGDPALARRRRRAARRGLRAARALGTRLLRRRRRAGAVAAVAVVQVALVVGAAMTADRAARAIRAQQLGRAEPVGAVVRLRCRPRRAVGRARRAHGAHRAGVGLRRRRA